MSDKPREIPEPGSPEWQDWLTVTSPLVPDLEEIIPMLRAMLERNWLTNQGPFLRQLEQALVERLGVGAVAVVTNGTAAIELAIRSCLEEGDVICTAYSFPATWNLLADDPRYRPVFVDIGDDFLIDPKQVEAAITPRTRGIMAVHAYGYPCDHGALSALCRRYDLKLIYDAAHCFGVRVDGEGIGAWGDRSTFSFHATKVFNTLEGGCVTADTPQDLEQVERRRNFGIQPGEPQAYFGQNAKMDEFRALFGLAALGRVDNAIGIRSEVSNWYIQRFTDLGIDEIQLPIKPLLRTDIDHNHAYFPIRIRTANGVDREQVFEALKIKAFWRDDTFKARHWLLPSIEN